MNQESGPSGRGLLSKVVKFVKSPTTHWSDLDRPESVADDSESRLALREMIERKRRNDFVRKREFDMLRKMRRSEVLAGQDPAARPSNGMSSCAYAVSISTYEPAWISVIPSIAPVMS